jgi:nucleoside 2-deoxyribosyltransferase
MNAINNADVLIAEVSDQNPNVMFELGYAYAFGKVVILMTQDVSKSPFDILGDRQLIYAEHPTNADEDELRKWLLTALSSDAD